MKILVCNAGSTSLKFKLYEMPGNRILAKCSIAQVESYEDGIRMFLSRLTEPDCGVIKTIDEIERVGFKPTLSKGHYGVHEMNGETLQGMKDWMCVSPIHNSAYLTAVDVVGKALPNALLVGCFETGFHRTIPLERKLYGVPYSWYEDFGIQRLGYHGASHSYIASRLDEISKTYRAISCHLGGSGSVCAIKDGKSVDTSFGMSLESGLIHVNRVGDMDCELMDFLKNQGLSDKQINDGLQKKGGILGIAGTGSDIKDVVNAAKAGNKRAKLALDAYVSGIVHYIGAFYVDLEGLDYLTFAAGIGENSDYIREMICSRLGILGVRLDADRNAKPGADGVISSDDSAVRVLVIPTDEEFVIAQKTYAFDVNSSK